MAENDLYGPALQRAFQGALLYLDSTQAQPISPTASMQELRTRIDTDWSKDGLDAELVIADLLRQVEGGILGSSAGRFFGWVIGGALPAALAADWLVSTWDQNAALYGSGPAAAIVEEVAGKWLKQILGIPPTASFAFVTGCQMAHFTCLAAARNALLASVGHDVEAEGLYGAPPIHILANAERHATVDRAVRMLGMGASRIESLETDCYGRVHRSSLVEALNRIDRSPCIVILQAGDINTGSFDRFKELIPVARAHGAWVHVDGAFGLWAAASPTYRSLLDGAELAHSWATDGHKWLNVPFDSGYAFVANPKAHHSAMSLRASYVDFSDQARNALDWTPEWSRRARGVTTYAALRQLGESGLSDLVDRCCRHAKELTCAIARLPGARAPFEPILNQGLVHFVQSDSASDLHNSQFTDEVIRRIDDGGEAFFTGSLWQGRRVMRVSVCNWKTTDEDIRRAVGAVARALQMEHH